MTNMSLIQVPKWKPQSCSRITRDGSKTPVNGGTQATRQPSVFILTKHLGSTKPRGGGREADDTGSTRGCGRRRPRMNRHPLVSYVRSQWTKQQPVCPMINDRRPEVFWG